MEIMAKPKRTFGLIVGIEKYHESQWNVTGGGTADDALKFAHWLHRRGVPRENIRLCLSALEENHQLIGECGLTVELATEQNISDIVTNFLSSMSGDLLYIFWAGHGFITSERERRLLCADANKQNWQNLDLNSLLVLLGSDKFQIRNHICIIDACANYVLESKGRPTNLGGKAFLSGQPKQDSQQFVLLATREGEQAKVNSENKTGYFSQAVREALAEANETFPPNMREVTDKVKQLFTSLDKKQLPTYFYSRSWDGDIEKSHFNPFDIPHDIPQSQARKFVGKKLACLLSLFALAPIPWYLVESAASYSDLEFDIKGNCAILVERYLLQELADDTYQVHDRIQKLLRQKLEELAEADELKRGFCQAMVEVAQDISDTPTLIEIAQATLPIPHLAETATVYQAWLSDNYLIWPFIGLGRFYQGQGAYEQALPWFEQSLSSARKRFGDEHRQVATSLNNLAELYRSQGRYSDAEPLYIEAVEIAEKRLGANHPNTITFRENLEDLRRNHQP